MMEGEMTSDLTETARRVVQLDGWTPAPGWRGVWGPEHGDGHEPVRVIAEFMNGWRGFGDESMDVGLFVGLLPDLSDDATLGILAACARRWQGCDVSVLRVPGGWQLVDPWHMEQCTRWGPVCDHPAQCYAFALEAAPRGQR